MRLRKSSSGHIEFDLLLSGLILVLSAVSSLTCYSKIKYWLDNQNKLILGELPKSDHSYFVFLGNTCVGELLSHYSGETLDQYSLDMKLRLKYQKQYSQAQIKFQATFNPIGQLVKSDLSVQHLSSAISIKLDGIDPLKIVAKADFIMDQELKQEFPGPVILFEYKPGKYALSAPFLKSVGNYSTPLRALLPEDFAPRLESAQLGARCSEGQIDVAALDQALSTKLGLFGGLLKGIK